MMKCRLCPRECNINRDEQLGFCKSSNTIKLARAALHYYEEPCISGGDYDNTSGDRRGSGAVFFSGCNLKCIFCQNRSIALGDAGIEITGDRLNEIFWQLKEKGAYNINLVTPSHYIHLIAPAIEKARKEGIGIPFIYNTSSYEKVESIERLDGLIDVYLPDFKYMDDDKAGLYSNACDYSQWAKLSIAAMYKQVGKCEFDERGMIKKGMIVRHLLLPEAVSNAKRVVEYLYNTYGDSIFISLMNQYTPPATLLAYKELNRKVTKREYEKLLNFAISIGVKNCYFQDGNTANESFIPEFNGEGV